MFCLFIFLKKIRINGSHCACLRNTRNRYFQGTCIHVRIFTLRKYFAKRCEKFSSHLQSFTVQTHQKTKIILILYTCTTLLVTQHKDLGGNNHQFSKPRVVSLRWYWQVICALFNEYSINVRR